MKSETQKLLIGFTVGLATAAALPVLIPVARDVGRPLLKSLLKHGLLGLDRAQTALASAGETVQDIVAEARAEVDAELAPRAAATASQGTPPQGDAQPASATLATPSHELS